MSSVSSEQCEQCEQLSSPRHLDASADHYEPAHTSFCPDGVPLEFALLSLLAAFGAAFGILYVALTQAGGGRRKRSSDGGGAGHFLLFNTEFADLLWTGKALSTTEQ